MHKILDTSYDKTWCMDRDLRPNVWRILKAWLEPIIQRIYIFFCENMLSYCFQFIFNLIIPVNNSNKSDVGIWLASSWSDLRQTTSR